MPLSFRSSTIPGVYEEPKVGPWAIQVSRQQYHGVEGESEIRGASGGRELIFQGVWKNNYASGALLLTAIEALNKQAPINGTLTRTGPISDSYKNCTLEGVTRKLGPLPSTQHGWFALVEIRFRQLGQN